LKATESIKEECCMQRVKRDILQRHTILQWPFSHMLSRYPNFGVGCSVPLSGLQLSLSLFSMIKYLVSFRDKSWTFN